MKPTRTSTLIWRLAVRIRSSIFSTSSKTSISEVKQASSPIHLLGISASFLRQLSVWPLSFLRSFDASSHDCLSVECMCTPCPCKTPLYWRGTPDRTSQTLYLTQSSSRATEKKESIYWSRRNSRGAHSL